MTTSEKSSPGPRSSRFLRFATIATLAAALTAAGRDAYAQTLTLEYQRAVTRTVPGATAAFSLDPSRVTASAHDGVVTLFGRGPGATSVVVVIGERTESFQVVVSEPPVVFRPGMRDARAAGAESGQYELRYGSDPGIVYGNLRFSRREGDRSTELAVGGAAPFGAASASPFSVPLASYTVRSPGRELTLLDRVVTNSPLTVSRSNVRGLHLQQGPWQAHAGYSFFGNFEHLFLPTEKESVAGVGYRYELTPGSSLTPNVYYFDRASGTGSDGPLGTLLYEARPARDMSLAAELGVGRTLAGAFEFDLDSPTRRAWARLRLAPPDLPSLSTDQQSGRHVEGGWTARGATLTVNTSASARSYTTGTADQTSTIASIDLQRRLTDTWAIHGGSGYSLFESPSSVFGDVHSVTLPAGIAFSRRYLGAGLDYQFSRETARDLAGHLLRANVNLAPGSFRFSMHAERETHAPTARYISTEVPWLQPVLDRLGLAADTPQALADLLRTNAELSAFGYPGSVGIDITPARTRAGASIGWSGSGSMSPQLFASTLFTRDELIDRTAVSGMHSVSYSQRLGGTTEVFLTWSALCNGGAFEAASCRPAMFASLRRTLTGVPGILGRRQGIIQGTVFQDDEGRGTYSPELPTVVGVEIVLDGVRSTRTDAAGRFRFDDVPYGRHRVEARFVADRRTFFTTPSPADVDADASVHFGIGRARSSIRGSLRTDRGTGVAGVVVHIAGAGRQVTARTGEDGSFLAEGLNSGVYDVSIEPGSVPPGYAVDALVAERVSVDDAATRSVGFVLQPYRSVSGRARLFDREKGEYVALSGVTVELLPLRRQSVTDANGAYAFRDLPPGEFRIVTTYGGQEHTATVTVPEGPSLVKNIDVAVVPRGHRPSDAATLLAGVPHGGGPSPRAPERKETGGNRRRTVDGAGSVSESPVVAASAAARHEEAFTIEVAASPSARHARDMVNELKDAGHAAYLIEPSSARSAASYHVFVGRYSTLAEANRSARTLEKALGWPLQVTPASAAERVVRGKTASYSR